MDTAGQSPSRRARSIPALRWWIGGLLFSSTVINYIDRQTLSWLAAYLQSQYHWTNSDYANLAVASRGADSIGQTVFGKLMDRIGTRRGLTLSVLGYSIVSVLTSLARGFYGLASFRFLLGAGESANWPAATKAGSEGFPKRERGLATALFDSGSSIGAAITPYLTYSIYSRWGWRPAFMVPGALGFLWLIVWRWVYHPPESHPLISEAELRMIEADKRNADAQDEGTARPRWRDLLRLPQTWGTIVARSFTDPVFFFIAEWFPIYLVAKGVELKTSLYLISFLFAFATFSYAGFTIMANVLPSDLYHSESVASVSGLSGTGAGIGTIIAFKFIGYLSDARRGTGTHSFDPIVIAAGLVPFVGMLLVLLLIRNTQATNQGLVRRI